MVKRGIGFDLGFSVLEGSPSIAAKACTKEQLLAPLEGLVYSAPIFGASHLKPVDGGDFSWTVDGSLSLGIGIASVECTSTELQ